MNQLTSLLTAEGLEKNLEVGLRMDNQNQVPLTAIIMYLSTLGLYPDMQQIKDVSFFQQALKGVPNTAFSEDTGKIFVNLGQKKTLVLARGVESSKVTETKKYVQEKSGVKGLIEEYKPREQTLAFRASSEQDAAALENWLKANPLEVR